MGTLFWVFPQTPTDENSLPAEIIEVSPPPGSIGPGPSDDRMYVIFPVDKPMEYGMHEDDNGNPYVFLPPWDGPLYEPAVAGEDGNFLHYDDIDDPRFHTSHTYASIRFTLDVWERYYSQPIQWYFQKYYDRAEVVVIPEFDNAQIGRGFIELGTDVDKKSGAMSPFTLNFDVIAHEIGHGIVFAKVGEPDEEKETAEYLGFQESGGDIVSMIAILHFDSVIDEILEATSGNLYMVNHLNRFAETSSVGQIRMASNAYKLSDFSAGWKDSHILAQPLTGAMFDILVDIFHEELVRVGAISASLEEMSDLLEGSAEYGQQLQQEFDNAYLMYPELFRESLIYARDVLATLLVETWDRLSPNYLTYADVYRALLASDKAVFNGLYGNIINVNFKWREIGTAVVGPRLPKDKDEGHSHGGGHSHGKGHDHAEQADDEHAHHSDEDDSNDISHASSDHADTLLKDHPRAQKSYSQRYRAARLGE